MIVNPFRTRRHSSKKKRGKKRKSNRSNSALLQTPKKSPASSYAARINASPLMATQTHSVQFRSVKQSSPASPETPASPCTSQHGKLSHEELLRVRMFQRTICYVVGLPQSESTRSILGNERWFGRFGRIRDITITDNAKHRRCSAHIKFFNEPAATSAVEAMDGWTLDDGQVLTANFGTQRYCPHFIQCSKCLNTRCPFRHSWCRLQDVMYRTVKASTKKVSRSSRKLARALPSRLPPPQFTTPRKELNVSASASISDPSCSQMTPKGAPSKTTVALQAKPTEQQQQPQRVQPQQTMTPSKFPVLPSPMMSTQSVSNEVASMVLPESTDSDVTIDNVVGSHPVETSDKKEVEWLKLKQQNASLQSAMREQQEEAALYKIRSRDMEETMRLQMARIDELTLVAQRLLAERESMTSKYKKVVKQCGLEQQQNRFLMQRVLEMKHAIVRMDAHSKGLQLGMRGPSHNHSRSYSYSPSQQTPLQPQLQPPAAPVVPPSARPVRPQQMVEYELWEWPDVYRWILSLNNGRMTGYAPMLEVALKREAVDGPMLKTFTANDLHRIGISHHLDQLIVLQHIGSLKSLFHDM